MSTGKNTKHSIHRILGQDRPLTDNDGRKQSSIRFPDSFSVTRGQLDGKTIYKPNNNECSEAKDSYSLPQNHFLGETSCGDSSGSEEAGSDVPEENQRSYPEHSTSRLVPRQHHKKTQDTPGNNNIAMKKDEPNRSDIHLYDYNNPLLFHNTHRGFEAAIPLRVKSNPRFGVSSQQNDISDVFSFPVTRIDRDITDDYKYIIDTERECDTNVKSCIKSNHEASHHFFDYRGIVSSSSSSSKTNTIRSNHLDMDLKHTKGIYLVRNYDKEEGEIAMSNTALGPESVKSKPVKKINSNVSVNVKDLSTHHLPNISTSTGSDGLNHLGYNTTHHDNYLNITTENLRKINKSLKQQRSIVHNSMNTVSFIPITSISSDNLGVGDTSHSPTTQSYTVKAYPVKDTCHLKGLSASHDRNVNEFPLTDMTISSTKSFTLTRNSSPNYACRLEACTSDTNDVFPVVKAATNIKELPITNLSTENVFPMGMEAASTSTQEFPISDAATQKVFAVGVDASSKFRVKESDSDNLTLTKSGVTLTLLNSSLWRAFNTVGTEMIINRSGRRMFPYLSLSVQGLEPNTYYNVSIQITPASTRRCKFINSKWVSVGLADAETSQLPYFHLDSPSLGRHWNRTKINFSKIKLSNNKESSPQNILLHSMHKYSIVTTFTRADYGCPSDATSSSNRCSKSSSQSVSFHFPETDFVAVTAYQNESVTQMKIHNNPFAKAFRDTSFTEIRKRIALRKRKRTPADRIRLTPTSHETGIHPYMDPSIYRLVSPALSIPPNSIDSNLAWSHLQPTGCLIPPCANVGGLFVPWGAASSLPAGFPGVFGDSPFLYQTSPRLANTERSDNDWGSSDGDGDCLKVEDAAIAVGSSRCGGNVGQSGGIQD